MKLKISRSKNSCNLYVQKAFRDNSGKSTSKIIEKLGSPDEIKARTGCADPFEWAKRYVAELTANEKEESEKTVTLRLCPGKRIESGVRKSYGCGYLFLQQLYYMLGIDRITNSISKRYGFDYPLDSILQTLVFGRILFPSSKKATFTRAGEFFFKTDFKLHDVYRALGVLAGEDDYIQRRLFLNSKSVVQRDTTVLYYDCTNYFFETEEADGLVEDKRTRKKRLGLRQYGVSKEHRPNPIVQMGLFIDKTGLPLGMCIHTGNNSEQNTLQPLEKKIIEGMGVERIVVCTDGGLSCEDNRAFNSTATRSFITVQSLKKLSDADKEWALETDGWRLLPMTDKERRSELNRLRKTKEDLNKPESEILPDETPDNPDDGTFDISKQENASLYYGRTFYREKWIRHKDSGFEQRLIVTFSYRYRAYLGWMRQQRLARAEGIVARGSKPKAKPDSPMRYVSEAYATGDGEEAVYRSLAINTKAIEDEKAYDGFYGICTDLEGNSVDEIIGLNHNRWESEESFRIIKTDFKGRPAFVWTEDNIRGHFITCFIALLLHRVLEQRLGQRFTSNEILTTLRSMNLTDTGKDGYLPAYTRTDLTDALHAQAGFYTDTQFVTTRQINRIQAIVKKS